MGAAPAGSVGALKVVPKCAKGEREGDYRERGMEKNWDSRRRGSQRCLVH